MNQIAFMNHVGEAVLKESIRETYYQFSPKRHTYPKYQPTLVGIASQAVAFMSGTGLEMMLEYYQLDYDPDVLRELLCEKYKVRHL